ncbi:hypothetical protein IC608_05015 [Devosia sp. PTR5]|jgi:hypothetical protein|uniref:Uncharacterized protein n=1 Tax=Devosia oryzisoli TaxID=2774138 RepID=A0A927IRW3_9HYPH|nr:hypothetical protein [Devosia oryzisoli]MBD8064834.1 hypothetical protein [Devosia oryzisoli]
MQPPSDDPDPYAELDNRADAGELSEEFRRPVRIRFGRRRDLPMTRTSLRNRQL